MTRAEFAAVSLRAAAANFRSRNVRVYSGDSGDRQHQRIKAARRNTIRRHISAARVETDLTKWDALPGDIKNRIYWSVKP